MIKVITYGTFDMFHFGHMKLLERAKALGDYLIVGVTSDDFDITRGKINNRQSIVERVQSVKDTGLADKIVIEEYEGQKIDDIIKYKADIFTVGSDWVGKFDYLNEYCKVIYLERTKGISSSELRSEERKLKIGFAGDFETNVITKHCKECKYVNGAEISGAYVKNEEFFDKMPEVRRFNSFEELVEDSDAVYIDSYPGIHEEQIRYAIVKGCHVLVESPITINPNTCKELIALSKKNNVVLLPALKTANATAYKRLCLLLKTGKIGKVISVDATCTSLNDVDIEKLKQTDYSMYWNSLCAWGPTAMLPVLQILGTDYKKYDISTYYLDRDKNYDLFTNINFVYEDAVANVKVGRGVKSEGDLVIAGTLGYIYVPSPWWKTDYFEIRYDNATNNKRYFYQLEGEGIRNELINFTKCITMENSGSNVSEKVSIAMSDIISEYYHGNVNEIR